jgi:hypothetical protein
MAAAIKSLSLRSKLKDKNRQDGDFYSKVWFNTPELAPAQTT